MLSECVGKTGHQFLENKTEAELKGELIKDKTTKDDVLKLYGEPKDIDKEADGREKWTYEFIRSDLKPAGYIPYVNLCYTGTDDKIKKLKIYFDDKGRYQYYACANATGETKAGLLGK